MRRDALGEADNLYWASLSGGNTVGVEAVAELTDLAELLTRIRIVNQKDVGIQSEIEAAEAVVLLRGVQPLPVTISQASMSDLPERSD